MVSIFEWNFYCLVLQKTFIDLDDIPNVYKEKNDNMFNE